MIVAKLEQKRVRKGKKLNFIIEGCVARFHSEVVPSSFHEAAAGGLEDMPERLLRRSSDEARQLGVVFPKVRQAKQQIGTVLSDPCSQRLDVAAAWIGVSRQKAMEACIAYGLRLIRRPNPDRGELIWAMHELLVLPEKLKYHRLRFVVENEFV